MPELTHPLFYHSTFLINFGTDKQKQLTVNKVDYFVPLYLDNVFDKPNEQNEACFNSAMARKRRPQVNVFDKPNEQNEACFNSAMARKRRPQVNVFDKPNEQNEACFNSAMARKRRQQANVNANAAIERGQSDACIDSAEREQRRPKANCCLITLQLLPNHTATVAQSPTKYCPITDQSGNSCDPIGQYLQHQAQMASSAHALPSMLRTDTHTSRHSHLKSFCKNACTFAPTLIFY